MVTAVEEWCSPGSRVTVLRFGYCGVLSLTAGEETVILIFVIQQVILSLQIFCHTWIG